MLSSERNIPRLKYVTHNNVNFYSFKDFIVREDCPMCGAKNKYYCEAVDIGHGFSIYQIYRICPCCGWWSYTFEEADIVDGGSDLDSYLSHLKYFSVDNPEIPLDQLMKYLSNKPHVLSDIHHRKFEEAVASIYKEVYGYQVIITKQTRDKGIDLYIFDSDSGKAAVEIKQKRSMKKPVSISAVRELVGAAFPRGFKNVHLVTNGRFSRDCYEEAEFVSNSLNLDVTFVDFKDIVAALEILRHDEYSDYASSPLSCPLWKPLDMYGETRF